MFIRLHDFYPKLKHRRPTKHSTPTDKTVCQWITRKHRLLNKSDSTIERNVSISLPQPSIRLAKPPRSYFCVSDWKKNPIYFHNTLWPQDAGRPSVCFVYTPSILRWVPNYLVQTSAKFARVKEHKHGSNDLFSSRNFNLNTDADQTSNYIIMFPITSRPKLLSKIDNGTAKTEAAH